MDQRFIDESSSSPPTSSLVPISETGEPSVVSKILSGIQTLLMIVFGMVGGILFLVIYILTTISGIGPLLEFWQSQLDKSELQREKILEQHPEMFLLEIPVGINKASGDRSYKVMVRLTRPSSNDSDQSLLPPVILPGGLASNLMTMSRHQDELTKKGFVVVNFDRLGVGLSDPYATSSLRPPSAMDVANELNYVMEHCGVVPNNQKWIQVGGSMGTNVATAFVALYPGRIAGFFNLDGLPHAFLQIQCQQFLETGPQIMGVMRRLRWTGLPRLAFSMALKPMIPAIGNVFTPRQIIGAMCREQAFLATGLEYVTLMSCCDLEVAAWGPQATTEYDVDTMFRMTSSAPFESVLVDEMKGIPRSTTDQRSKSELGGSFVKQNDPEFVTFKANFSSLALETSEAVNKVATHCDWPDCKQHPVGEYVGGVEADTEIAPLAKEFQNMVVRVMCARNYKGLERDYTQEARNHAAARTSLHVLASNNGKAYYYPELTHLNLWQQCNEIVNITCEMAQAIISDREQP